MQKTAFVIYVLLLHVALGVLLWRPELLPKAKAKLGLAKTSNPQLERMLIYHTAMDGSIEPGASIFLGDSITQSLATSSVADRSVNFGIGQQTTAEMLTALPNYKSLGRARTVYIMIGINDLLQGKAEGLIERYGQIVKHIPPTTQIVWSAVMPTSSGAVDRNLIRQVERDTSDFCKALTNCRFVETGSLFTTEDGSVDPSNFLDGLHLSTKGYARWIQALK